MATREERSEICLFRQIFSIKWMIIFRSRWTQENSNSIPCPIIVETSALEIHMNVSTILELSSLCFDIVQSSYLPTRTSTIFHWLLPPTLVIIISHLSGTFSHCAPHRIWPTALCHSCVSVSSTDTFHHIHFFFSPSISAPPSSHHFPTNLIFFI